MPHHNAKPTQRGREQLVRLAVAQQFSYGKAAAWGHVSKSTVWEWVGRYRAATPENRSSLACFCERSSRPRRSPSQLPAEEAQKICELRKQTGWSARRIACELDRPHSTVHRAVGRGGCSRRPRCARR